MPHGWLPNPETFTSSPSCTSWSSIPHFTHSPSVLQTLCYEHTKPHVLTHTKKVGYTKPRAHFFAQGALNAPNQVSTFNQLPVTLLHKGYPDTLYGTSTPPFKFGPLTILFPFATVPAALHYFNIHTDYFLHNMVCDLFCCILLIPSHTSPSPLSTLLSPLPAIHPASLPCTFYQQQDTIL